MQLGVENLHGGLGLAARATAPANRPANGAVRSALLRWWGEVARRGMQQGHGTAGSSDSWRRCSDSWRLDVGRATGRQGRRCAGVVRL